MEDAEALQRFLVARRARLVPEQVGLPTSARRRVSGLRREEVAHLAGISSTSYTRLERGLTSNVSRDVIVAVARALRLDEKDREALLTLAAPNTRRTRAIRPAPSVGWGTRAVLNAALVPATVHDGLCNVVAANSAGADLFRFVSTAPDTEPFNTARIQFLEPPASLLYLDLQSARRDSVATLRDSAEAMPDDDQLAVLLDELGTKSTVFRQMWAAPPSSRRGRSGLLRVHHPRLGDLAFERTAMAVKAGPTHAVALHTVVFYTPADPRTVDAVRLLGRDAHQPHNAASERCRTTKY
ncbi:helix-turn-helix transcriptional regulator [Curtobacterium sp. ISL-83]|uniref:helix-turn-helix transcriptional regulator n=1 Tax=Curtobacterium sp. ISL-83 TaxID=2819145 RepID=UPI001BE846CA|nr:helix-turn-helix transcriptional regulator [Curtobacterium sp. ISL-83]MBT2501713.1 helix-turn-helix domain-containing protein [Curtobacterium sp. ISL-83]